MTLDYRFGWRWLLPFQRGQTFRVHGFIPEEVQFWHAELQPFGPVALEGNAGAWLIDADRFGRQANSIAQDIGSANWVCVVANRSNAVPWRIVLRQQFPSLREYGLLPSGNPRLVVPLSSSRKAALTLGLHRPERLVARLGLEAGCLLARTGHLSALRSRVLLIASRDPKNLPWGAAQAELPTRLPELGLDYALYLGTPDDNRKTTVLPLSKSTPDIILKVASLPKARAALQNEAATLAILQETTIAECLPKLRGLVASGDTLTLFQEFRLRQRANNRKMTAAATSFLGRLTWVSRQVQSLTSLLNDMPVEFESKLTRDVLASCQALQRHLQSLAQSGLELLVCRSHGDFAPWNCAWTDRGFYVFDWEESREQALALGDAFYYTLAPVLHVRHNASVPKTLAAALCLGEQTAVAGGLTGIDVRVYLALWLMRQLSDAVLNEARNRAHKINLYGAMLKLLEQGWQCPSA